MIRRGTTEILKQAFDVIRERLPRLASFTFEPNSSEADLTGRRALLIFDDAVQGGKCSRSKLAINTFRAASPFSDDAATLRVAQAAVGIEILQCYFLIFDDIMDASETRRGKLCWYRRPSVGMSAINDGVLLDVLVRAIIRDAFPSHPNLSIIERLFAETKHRTVIGQLIDWESQRSFADFNFPRYHQIVDHKTSDYSFWLPVQLGLLAADNLVDSRDLKNLCYNIGYFFQAQDDFLDVFGNADVTGKIGTDIQDGKCTWLSAKTMQLIENKPELQSLFQSSYGKSDPESIQCVRALFEDVNLKTEFEKFEASAMGSIKNDINVLSSTALRPVFFELIESLMGRKK